MEMTNDDIVKVARECGCGGWEDELITFARRIAAMQREIDAGICDRRRRTVSNGNGVSMWSLDPASTEASYCAAAIREQSDE